MIYDLGILGGGPAAVSAGVYAARKRLKTVLITKDWNGQSVVSEGIENWIGEINISGLDLSNKLENHVKHYAKDIVTIRENEIVQSLKKSKSIYVITTNRGSYEVRSVLIATGSSRRKLDVPGAYEYDNKGLTYCASCDGPMYADKDVAVIGGGNAAFETAAQLSAYCKSVTILVRSEYRADAVTVESVLRHPRVKVIKGIDIKKVSGDKFVKSLTYTDRNTGNEVILPVEGIFVEIGSIPNTDYAKGIVPLDEYGRILVDPRNQRVKGEAVWAAGDCTDGLYHQNNIAAGDAVKALEDIYLFIHANS